MDIAEIKNEIETGQTVLGIEFGSTRIKAVLIGSEKTAIATGGHDWENRYIDGVWSYTIEDIHEGLVHCYSSLKESVKDKYGIVLRKLKAIGISGMMHGILALDENDELLTPFRTWRNTITEEESAILTEMFNYPIPQRWTISHLLKDIRKDEPYLKKVHSINTLASYIQYRLTGKRIAGIGECSGMFPVDTINKCYDRKAIKAFEEKYLEGKYDFRILDAFPRMMLAGETAGYLTEEGRLLLDPEGDLESGIPFCPPEGDGETGMIATNAVAPRTGNVSAGTSAFALIVLEKPLSRAYDKLDLITTPDGNMVAMAHSNNCTGSYDAWMKLFHQVIEACGFEISKPELYDAILNEALKGDKDCGGLLNYGYIGGEHITEVAEGRPMFLYHPNANFTLPNFIRSELMTNLCAMRCGLDILFNEEHVKLDIMNGHGGFFKTPLVGQRIMAAAMKAPIRVIEGAGEGGAWGIALLADYMSYKDMSLGDYLDKYPFAHVKSTTVDPDPEDIAGFDRYQRRHIKGLPIERAAAANLTEED